MSIIRISTFYLALFVLVCAANAQPKLVVIKEYDWGMVVPSGPSTAQQSVRTKLSLKNTGDAMLRIREVRPSCGCVTPKLERDSIAPQEEVFVDISMNLPVGNGPVKKTLTVHTNEPTDSMHVVVLKAELVRPIQLSSGFIPFNASHVGDTTSGIITVTSFASDDITLTVAPASKNIEVASQNPVKLTKGVPHTIHLVYRPDKSGSYSVNVDLRTSLPGYEVIPISGFGVADPAPKR